MRVAVLGLGAIGRVLAGALAGRVDVVGIDRTRAPLRDGEAPVDVAVVCVKTPGTLWAAEIAGRIVAPDGVAITIQNGMGNRDRLIERLGAPRSVLGAIYVGAYEEDGEIRVSGTPRLELARPAELGPAERVAAFAGVLREAGWDVSLVDDVLPVLWRKVVVNVAVNPVTAVLDIHNGELLGDAGGALVADALAREAAAVARASGVAITDAEAEALWRDAAERTATNISSMLQDVRARRETEIDSICGGVVRNAERRGTVAPLNAAMAYLIGALHTAG